MTVAPSSASAASTTHAISLAQRVGHAFPPHTIVQGFACHAQGVDLDHVDRRSARARVRGDKSREIELRATDGQLVIGCTCPARSFGVDACVHAWAVLLEIDRTGGLEELRSERSPIAVVGGEPPSSEPVAKRQKKPTSVDAKSKPKRTAKTPRSQAPDKRDKRVKRDKPPRARRRS
jgi:hypothetical protein